MKLKCLQLENWMAGRVFREDVITHSKAYHQIDPILDRDGYYCVGTVSWFEVGGQAWMCDDTHSFNFNLNRLSASELRPEQIAGLQAITETNLFTKKQRDLWISYCDYRTIRNTSRGSMRARLGVQKLYPVHY